MNDDRRFRAEDLLSHVVDEIQRHETPTRDAVNAYLNDLERRDELDEVPTAPTRQVEQRLAEQPVVPATASLPDTPPIEVPNHTLIRCLGVGGFGQVWLAKHALTEHYRACKLIPSDKAIELDGIRHLKQRVPDHPNLFPIEELGSVDGWLYCLMPLAESAATDHAVLESSSYEPMTLHTYLDRHGRRPSAEVAQIGADLARAVRHLHAHGVTHGDIKPANIMRIGGRWLLADYGLVRNLSKPTGDGHTPAYTPPEGAGTTGADQFALGIVLMELLTGWPARMLKDFREVEVTKFKFDSEGPALAAIIRHASSDDPNQRYGSIDELIDELSAFTSSRAARGIGLSPARLWSAIAVIAAVVALAAVFLSPLLRSSSKQDNDSLADAAALPVESFEVRHYHYDATSDTTIPVGSIDADNPAARANDDVTVHARFKSPQYCYLLSLDADGLVRPRLPDSPTDRPLSMSGFDYPSLPTNSPDDIMYTLSEGVGTQSFMLLVSDDPLPSWSDWIASRGEPTWTRESLPANGVILFDGVKEQFLSATREPMPRRGKLLTTPIDWARAQNAFTDIRFIAFPVLPAQEN
ncbi:MAG: serine/threonine protein kinase [Phycisphaeraceae bacterium]|nr:serine/threonine protein kinase [Phycisphaerales bacterium]MCB9843668.1 serine/threonine protein kinase [Phycisphaeraceae bacterium]